MIQTEAHGTQTAPPQAAKLTPDGARDTGPALELHYRFVLWLVPTLDRFPRAQRFLLGDRRGKRSKPIFERGFIFDTYANR